MSFLRRPQRRRPVIQRIVFVCQHPHFEEDRMLAQELFRPRFFADARLAHNECRAPGNVRQLARRNLTRLFDECDFLSHEDVGSFWYTGGLRPADVECRVVRFAAAPEHDWIYRCLPDERYVSLPTLVRGVVESVTERPKVTAE